MATEPQLTEEDVRGFLVFSLISVIAAVVIGAILDALSGGGGVLSVCVSCPPRLLRPLELVQYVAEPRAWPHPYQSSQQLH